MWPIPLISALQRERQEDLCGLETGQQVSIASSRSARVMQGDLVERKEIISREHKTLQFGNSLVNSLEPPDSPRRGRARSINLSFGGVKRRPEEGGTYIILP